MIDAIRALLHVVLTTLGVAASAQPASTATIAVAVLALAITAVLLLSFARPQARRGALARPRRAIDDSALISQSDPDAAGHPRSRAPGFAASAA